VIRLGGLWEEPIRTFWRRGGSGLGPFLSRLVGRQKNDINDGREDFLMS